MELFDDASEEAKGDMPALGAKEALESLPMGNMENERCGSFPSGFYCFCYIAVTSGPGWPGTTVPPCLLTSCGASITPLLMFTPDVGRHHCSSQDGLTS